MWQHLERLGGGIGTRGPGESQLETDRRLARRRIGLLKQAPRAGAASSRAAQRRAEALGCPIVALAGYTNDREVDAPERADGRRGRRRRPALRIDPTTHGFQHDGRRYLVTDTVGFIRHLPHQLVEGFAGGPGGDPARRPCAPRRRRGTSGRAPRRDDRRGRLRPRRHRRRRASDRARPQQDRPRRPAPAAARRKPLPRHPADLGPGWGGCRAARASPSASRTASASCACSSRTTRAASSRSCTTWELPSRSASTARTVSSSRARPPERELSLRVPDRGGGLTRRRGPRAAIELPVVRLREEATLPARAYAGDAGLDLAACERGARPRRARRRADRPGGSPSRSFAGAVQPGRPRRAARDRGRELAGTDRRRLPRLNPRRPPQHRQGSRPSSRRRETDRPARRLAGARARARRNSTSLAEASARSGASARPSPTTWSRASGCPPSSGARAGCSSYATKARTSTGSCRAAASRRGRRCSTRSSGACRGGGAGGGLPLGGRSRSRTPSLRPGGLPSTSSTSSSQAFSATGRSRAVTSGDEAVRNHRLFDVEELAELAVHPPIQRFLALAARRPDGVSRLALGTVTALRAGAFEVGPRKGATPRPRRAKLAPVGARPCAGQLRGLGALGHSNG